MIILTWSIILLYKIVFKNQDSLKKSFQTNYKKTLVLMVDRLED